MTTERPLSGDEIRALIMELPRLLEPVGVQHVVVLVGGSLLAWHGLRDSTQDVDSARRLDEELRDAATRLAESRALPRRWLNADAAMFLPATFDEATCDVLFEHPRLRVMVCRGETSSL